MEPRTRVALIPAYEPGDDLPGLVRELKDRGMEVFVVDDGSGGRFDAVFSACEAFSHVIRYTPNGGKGRALKVGYRAIRAAIAPPYAIVTLDADGQHSVKDALRVWEAASAQPKALILGSRKFDGDVPLRSRFGNTATRMVYRLATGIAVRDTQTGLRAFCDDLADYMMEIEGDRYEYEMNVLLKCTRDKIRIREIDIETIYLDNNSASHFNTLKDSARIYGNIMKFAATSFISFLADFLLYCVLVGATGVLGFWSVPASNALARAVSATVNYLLRRKVVAREQRGSAAKYFALAACILVANTAVLAGLVEGLHMDKYLAKLVVEVAFMAVSWMLQKKVLLKKSA